jgi:glycosyltransferase involved in cell wall biosynthesis
MWVYSRNLIQGFKEIGVTPRVIAGGSDAVQSELSQLLQDGEVEFLPASTWHRRFSIVRDLFLKTNHSGVLHGTSNLVPLSSGGICVVTLHDLLQGYPPTGANGGYVWLRQAVYRWIYKRLAKGADLIFTDRGVTAKDITERLMPRCKVVVLEPPLDSHYVKADLPGGARTKISESDEARVLAFASSDPRKNIGRVLEAVGEIGQGVRVTVVASSEAAREQVRACQRSNQTVDQTVDVVGGIAAEDMPALYRSHDLLIFPSLAEGFGYPAFEALSQGIPVVVPEGMVESPLYSEVQSFLFECDPVETSSITAQIKSAFDFEATAACRAQVAQSVRSYLAPAEAARKLQQIYKECTDGE